MPILRVYRPDGGPNFWPVDFDIPMDEIVSRLNAGHLVYGRRLFTESSPDGRRVITGSEHFAFKLAAVGKISPSNIEYVEGGAA